MHEVVCQAPVRISFAGGGTDIPSYFNIYGGCVISTTINHYIRVRIREYKKDGIKVDLQSYHESKILDDRSIGCYFGDHFDIVKAACKLVGIISGVEIIVGSSIHPASGLGTSSATAVSLLAALSAYKKEKLTKLELAQKAVDLERKMLKIIGGYQDQYAVSFGGLNFISFFQNNKISLKPLNVSAKTKERLQNNLMLYYLGGNRKEHKQQQMLVGMIAKRKSTLAALHRMKELCYKMRDSLLADDLEGFARLLHQSWVLKKSTSPNISNKKIDDVYRYVQKLGVIGGKLLGSGGGGCLLLCCPKEKQSQVYRYLNKNGGEFIPFRFESQGAGCI